MAEHGHSGTAFGETAAGWWQDEGNEKIGGSV